ncbi:MAG: crossover junction endodeoxyribonuclease RuvC [bacterium]
MGIDPGISATGFGIIIDRKEPVYGTIRPKEREYYKRILAICEKIKSLIVQYKPDVICLEKAFFQKNVASLIKISELRGSIIFLLLENGVRFIEYTPAQIKLVTTGNGRASKNQVRFVIERILLKNNSRISHHAVDALAIAYTAQRKLRLFKWQSVK